MLRALGRGSRCSSRAPESIEVSAVVRSFHVVDRCTEPDATQACAVDDEQRGPVQRVECVTTHTIRPTLQRRRYALVGLDDANGHKPTALAASHCPPLLGFGQECSVADDVNHWSACTRDSAVWARRPLRSKRGVAERRLPTRSGLVTQAPCPPEIYEPSKEIDRLVLTIWSIRWMLSR